MSAIGPELPPHLLAKRKRQLEDSGETQDVTPSGAKREASPGEGEKRRRVVGPAPPPAPLDERPAVFLEEEESSSDDDDGFGPALPSAAGHEVCCDGSGRELRLLMFLRELLLSNNMALKTNILHEVRLQLRRSYAETTG